MYKKRVGCCFVLLVGSLSKRLRIKDSINNSVKEIWMKLIK